MTATTRLEARTAVPARFTVDEFLELASSPVFATADKLELVDGVIVRMPPPHPPHMFYQRQVFVALHEIFGDGLDGYIAQFEMSLRLSDSTLLAADVGLLKPYLPRGRFIDTETVLLAVEIAHTSQSYDLVDKRLDYAGAGIPNYWVVDIVKRRTHSMARPLDGDYAERRPYAFGEPIPVPGTDRTIVIE